MKRSAIPPSGLRLRTKAWVAQEGRLSSPHLGGVQPGRQLHSKHVWEQKSGSYSPSPELCLRACTFHPAHTRVRCERAQPRLPEDSWQLPPALGMPPRASASPCPRRGALCWRPALFCGCHVGLCPPAPSLVIALTASALTSCP